MSDHGRTEQEAPRQVVHASGLELVADIQAVAAVVEIDVERILLPEVRIRVAFAGAIVSVLRVACNSQRVGNDSTKRFVMLMTIDS